MVLNGRECGETGRGVGRDVADNSGSPKLSWG
jgi:hypothetical protein